MTKNVSSSSTVSAAGVHVVVGARPNYMKVKVLLDLLPEATVIHTGQHYSPSMFGLFLEQLELPAPEIVLEPKRSSQVGLVSSLMSQFEDLWSERRPTLVLVVGDVNSTLAAAFTASRLGIPVAHIEAGLRSRDLSMPEEVNRIAVDACSRWLFATESAAVENLRGAGRIAGVHLVGNTMIDCLVALRERIRARSVLEDLGLEAGRYGILTLHRPSNVDDPERLTAILERLNAIGHPLIYPVHPRVTPPAGWDGIRMIQPQPYLDFIRLVEDCAFVITDSGGLQEETTFLGVPCVTLRANTERPSTVELGTNVLATDLDQVETALDQARNKKHAVPPLWDGGASRRIVEILHDAGALGV